MKRRHVDTGGVIVIENGAVPACRLTTRCPRKSLGSSSADLLIERFFGAFFALEAIQVKFGLAAKPAGR